MKQIKNWAGLVHCQTIKPYIFYVFPTHMQGRQWVWVIPSDLWKSLVQIDSESDFSFFPRLRVKIKKSILICEDFQKFQKSK